MPNDPNQARRDLDAMESQLSGLREQLASGGKDTDASKRLEALTHLVEDLRADLNTHLTPWQRVKLARHPQRPYFLDYVGHMFEGFSEVHGDRAFSDDPAIVCGMARFNGREILAVGHQKGRTTKDNLYRNFGYAKPEGYRKAIRAMEYAAKFKRPILTFLDTPGAYPGLDAEERGQAEAIASNLREMARLGVPVIVTVIGEGGSGGALGIGVGNRVLMLENSVYSVISPEGLRQHHAARRRAGRIGGGGAASHRAGPAGDEPGRRDRPEPSGGAPISTRRPPPCSSFAALERNLTELSAKTPAQLIRRSLPERFRRIGQFFRRQCGIACLIDLSISLWLKFWNEDSALEAMHKLFAVLPLLGKPSPAVLP